jgi:hypothetical protein
MINLAKHDPTPEQVTEATRIVTIELAKAGIPAMPLPLDQRGEVPATVNGQYEGISFRRAWYYWVVNGLIPLEVAKEIHANPNGVTDVRVQGHCGCPAPEDPWITRYDVDTKKIVVTQQDWELGCSMLPDDVTWQKNWRDNHIPESDVKGALEFIESYHIDTQEGLNWFMDCLRRNKVTGRIE